MSATLARLCRPVPIATRHIEHPLTPQVVAKPAQQGSCLPVTAEVDLMAHEGDRVVYAHPGSLLRHAGSCPGSAVRSAWRFTSP